MKNTQWHAISEVSKADCIIMRDFNHGNIKWDTLQSTGVADSTFMCLVQDRRQRVVVDGEVSSWKSVLSGVPQGSVRGPILVLVYINDLEEGVTGNILKFADDTKLFRKTKEIGDKQNVQDDIDKLVKWTEKWQMADSILGNANVYTQDREIQA